MTTTNATNVPLCSCSSFVAHCPSCVERRFLSAPPVPPCPSWCSMLPGHAWEALDPETGNVERFHRSDPSSVAWVSALETVDAAGKATLQLPRVEMVLPAMASGGMTAEQACDLARALLDAAERLTALQVEAAA